MIETDHTPLIIAQDISLEVPMFQPNERQLRQNPMGMLTDLYLGRKSRNMTTILNAVSFQLNRGERLGIIGHNGAGKSTLLRVLSGIYRSTSGTLNIHGQARGLFDISLGMNPEATGLENIYLRGLQMGFSLKRINDLIPQIVEFSELEESIDHPFNTYSTGMRMRLSFSISTAVEPDILLLDEWIGTGDANFRDKFKKRMERLIEKSRGLVLATHYENLMKAFCTHGLVLHEGRVMFYGDVLDALAFYEELRKNPPPLH